jgi:heat shock protein HslJ
MVVKTVIKEVDPAEGKFTLAKTKWKLIELNGKKVRQKGDKAYFIKLNSNDGKFNGYAGCNTFSGNYVMPLPRALAFTNIVLTRMACPNMELETQVLAMIETVDNYRIKSDILYLRKTKMTTVAKFEAVK